MKVARLFLSTYTRFARLGNVSAALLISLGGFLALTFAHWFAFESHHVMDHAFPGYAWLKLPVFLLLFFAVTYALVAPFARIRVIDQISASERPKKCLILLVSHSNMVFDIPLDGSGKIKLYDRKDKNKSEVKFQLDAGQDLDSAIEALNAVYWNWQQLLRAVEPHAMAKTLQHVRLVGSSGPGGSHRELSSCAAVLRRYLGDDVAIEYDDSEGSEGVDFEDFAALKEHLKDVLEKQTKCHRSADLAIDVTGGQKTAGIASAALTLMGHTTFQYVQSRAPGDKHRPEVFSYNAEFVSPMRPAE